MRFTLTALFWILLILAIKAQPPPVRLAVISDANCHDLAALVTAELSANSDIVLVERDALSKIGDEWKVQQLAGSDAVALGKLIGADGLIFINKGAEGLQVRFTAVGLGYALFDDQLASPTDLPQVAKSIAHRVAGYAPKLTLDPAKAIPISVLNLRADLATTDSTVTERKLTLLLESRLSSLPNYVVLERRHVWSLGFEHSLAPDSPAFLKGSYVIDGTLSFSLQNQDPEEIRVHLRLRSPNQQRTPVEITGPNNNLPALVEQMVDQIQKATGASSQAVAWDSKQEAREYLLEGLWGWEHQADDAALEALDSAELLGESAPDLVPLRISLLFKLAHDGLPLALKNSPTNPASFDQIIDYTLRAISEAARYDSEKTEAKLEFLTWQQHLDVRTGQIKENLSNFTTDLLVNLDNRQSPRADEVRKALRAVTGYDPLLGQLGRTDMSHPLSVMTNSKDQWDTTLQEQLAYFHLLCTTPNQYIPANLLTGQGQGFCKRFLKTPEEQKQAFAQFVQDLKNDPKGQLAYQLIMSCDPDDAAADTAYTAYWKEMWNQRESLVNQKLQVEEWTSARPVSAERRKKHADEMLPVLHYYLTHVNNYRYWDYAWETMWQPDQWSEADAATIWTDFVDFKKRAEADWSARGRGLLDLSEFEQPFQKKFPQIAVREKPDPQREPLVINHLWHPWLEPGSPQTISDYIVQFQGTQDALWLMLWFPGPGGDKHLLYQLSLPDLTAKIIDLPETMKKGGLLTISQDAVYIFDFPHNKSASLPSSQAARYDLKNQTWDSRTIDFSYLRPYAAGRFLYFDLSGGIGRYDWNSSQFTLLASSRRRPAQNQFDDCESYQIRTIFAGPGGKPCVATLQNGTYFISDQPGDWTPVFDSTFWTGSTTHQYKTIVYTPWGEVVLLDPDLADPQYLMTPTSPRYRKKALIHQSAAKEMAPWAGKAQWDGVEGLTFGSYVGGDQHRFYLLRTPERRRNSYDLVWYDDAHGRMPRIIPVQFVWSEAAKAALPPLFMGRKKMDIYEKPGTDSNLSVIAVRDGICFDSDNLGIWYVSYHEIDAYLKTHTTEQPTPVSSVSHVSKYLPEDDVESQVIGDMIDPAMASVSFR